MLFSTRQDLRKPVAPLFGLATSAGLVAVLGPAFALWLLLFRAGVPAVLATLLMLAAVGTLFVWAISQSERAARARRRSPGGGRPLPARLPFFVHVLVGRRAWLGHRAPNRWECKA